MVRKIEKFAVTHIFANVMIVVTIIVVVIYGFINLHKGGSQLDTIYAVNPETWPSAIGFSVFSYEGIGTVLPIRDITRHPENFNKILILVFIVSASIFVMLGNFCCIAWGN